MKLILVSACACSLLLTTGCLSSSAEWRGHANNARFGGFTMETPAVEVLAPVGQARAPVTHAQ
jgi:hypothetical protein